MTNENTLQSIVNKCSEIAFDLDYNYAKNWKNQQPDRTIVGYTPVYFPREIVHAAGGLAVGIFGAGDKKQIVKGDAYYQSYICHIPRGIIELGLDKNFAGFDGFVFPSICDVMRNLSGLFQVLKIDGFVKYFDFPQNFLPQVGGEFMISEMQDVLNHITKITGKSPSVEELNHSIGLFNKNRELIEFIYDVREHHPWRLTMEELYLIIRAGMMMPVEEHNEILEEVCNIIKEDIGQPMDKIKVIVSGSFCEQPSIGLIRTIENAGCYVIDDDLLLGSRMIEGHINIKSEQPLACISEAYMNKSQFSSSIYDVDKPKEQRLANLVKKRGADGVIFAAPSFCDPALLDAPIFQQGFNQLGIRYISFQYSENSAQYKVIKEQVGAFADSIKLWETEPVVIN